MSSATLSPVGDVDLLGTTIVGGQPTAWQTCSDASDSTYLDFVSQSSNSDFVKLTLAAVPGDFATCTAIQINVRMKRSSSKVNTMPSFKVMQSNGSTALSALATQGTNITTSFANYTFNPATSGSQDAAAWNFAKIWFGEGATALQVAEISVTITYTPAASSRQTLTLLGCGSAFLAGLFLPRTCLFRSRPATSGQRRPVTWWRRNSILVPSLAI